MSADTQELILLSESLPADKRAELADFARFLAARQQDERWEEILDSNQPRPRLEAFLRASASEGEELLDLKRL